jgi:uncharacterized protein YhaN
MRFLHAANVHLDSPCSSRSETVRHQPRDASRLAFQRLVDLAFSERVDAVLIAGDLFGDERLSFMVTAAGHETATERGDLSTSFPTPKLPQAGEAAVHVLRTKLRDAERAEQASKGARAEMDRLERDEAEIEGELVGQTEALDGLVRALGALGEGEVEPGIEAANRMRRAREAAAGIRADPKRSHPDLDDLLARLESCVDADELDIRRTDDDRILAAGKLSTGTKEQLYLAMRSAALDHLDHDRDRLPVFIDEAIVHWDAPAGSGAQLLRELSQTRQVLVMTCHERWAEEWIAAGANRIDLE